MSTLRLIAKICAVKICAIDSGEYPIVCSRDDDGNIEDPLGPTSVETEDSGDTLLVTVPLVSDAIEIGGEFNPIPYIHSESVIYPEICKVGEDPLTYEILGRPNVSPYNVFGAYYIKITGEMQDDICGFTGAKIIGEFIGDIEEYIPASAGGDIPVQVCIEDPDGEMTYEELEENDVIDDEYERIVLPNGEYTFRLKAGGGWKKVPVINCSTSDVLDVDSSFDNTHSGPPSEGDPRVVPGEEISLWWRTANIGSYQKIASDYIHTCCLTGGRIVTVDGSYGERTITYTVQIEGVGYASVRSSDFKEYGIGDWVYIMKQDASGCSSCDRVAGCEGDAYADYVDGGDYGIIIPIDIIGGGPP